jgi:hypothetical protein
MIENNSTEEIEKKEHDFLAAIPETETIGNTIVVPEKQTAD